MDKSDNLRLKDVRAAFRLIGECCELGRRPAEWRQHMLEGIRRITGAQVALYLHLRNFGSEDEQIVQPLDAGFFEPSHRALWVNYQRENAHRSDLFHQRFYRDFVGPVRTRRLEAVVDLTEWHRSRHYNEYIRACGLADRITSSLRLTASPSALQVIVVHRSAADGSYPLRTVRLVHLFHHEVRGRLGRQLSMTTANEEVASLPFQLRHVLFCLLQGDSEKQVAHRLGISRHTVNHHVQRLYRRFGVHSRGELMFRCREMFALLPIADPQ